MRHLQGKPGEVVSVAMLREVYKVYARIEKCSMNYDHVIVDGAAH
ncbi:MULTISPECIES: hypothetical protein [Phyllobacterium]|nr:MULTISPECIES: hypothetical protein [Phyllobacterium]